MTNESSTVNAHTLSKRSTKRKGSSRLLPLRNSFQSQRDTLNHRPKNPPPNDRNDLMEAFNMHT